MMQKGMIPTREVRSKVGVSRWQIHQYRKAGLFPFDPIAASYAGLGTARLYPAESLTLLEILEALRHHGFGTRAMKVLLLTMNISSELRGFISFADKARIVIDPERLEEAKAVIEAVIASYDRGYNL